MKSSKPKKSTTPDKSATAFLSGRTWAIGGLVIVGIVVAVVLNDRSSPSSPGGPTTPPASTNAPTPMAQAKPDFQKLKGRWLRPDGGYVIEIKSADEQGKLEAGYFNPQTIHVAKAEATQEGGATKVFIELQDVNYPGSTYRLVYVPDRDLLAGVYYQALQRQSFDVYFERMK